VELPRAHGGPPLRGILRASPEDFFVDEDISFAPDGAGEHVFVRVEKRGANIDVVARELARFAAVRAEAVSYAGLKDLHAVTRQMFSVHLPGKADPDWPALSHAEFHVLDAVRHSRKLQRGALKGNRFRIVLREVEGDRDAAEQIVDSIRTQGVPNYFGEQRFGRDAANVEKARAMFQGRRVQRHERSLFLSAARSQMFNAVLAERVEKGNWNRPLDGEVWMLEGTHSIFGPEPLTPELNARLERGDVAPTGPMWGAGELRTREAVADLENSVAARYPELAAGLASAGLRQERRSLVLRPRELELRSLPDSGIELSFYLNSGAYATVLLMEIFDYRGQI